jgi:DNA replication ATP-dependent helicase Dna2
LARNDFSPLRELLAVDDLALGKLYAPKRLQLQEALDKSLPEVRAYFEAFFAFVVREYRVSKLGGSEQVNDHGFSGLWRSTLREKKEDFGILYGYSIRFQHPDTDLSNGHFFLEPNDDYSITQANFRVGDIIVLYPYDPEQSDPAPTKNMVLKGYLKEMHENGVLISLRNKQVSDEFFVNHTHWAIEHDYMESGYLRLFESLASFLYAPDERQKRLILGLERPRFKDEVFECPLKLYPAQNHLFQQALNAEDYFLIQGPPGTGKTSTVLRSVAEYLYTMTDQNLLLLAFTNRAVDEIAQKLRDAKISYFRLGLGNDDKEDTLRSISNGKSFEELIQYYDGVRVYVSTVSSFLSNRGNLSHIYFSTAIIDEASQLLEPHLAGILPYVGRFILIGDEKQLPAIVTQPRAEGRIIHPELQACGFKNLGNSLFERLLSVCQQNGWQDAYGMLTNHFRMHEEIADFVSHQYYGGSLVATEPRQKEPLSLYRADAIDELEQILARNRLLFFDVKAEPLRSAKQSEAEARLIARIFEVSMERLAEQDITFEPAEKIGIITPFRAQIAVIRQMLPPIFIHKNRQWNDLRQNLTIDTVERYQGSERDLILVSLVVKDAYLAGNLCSLMDDGITDRKLNVTLSRAKEQIVLCGDAQTLSRLPSWKVFLDYCRQKGGFINSEKTTELLGQIILS